MGVSSLCLIYNNNNTVETPRFVCGRGEFIIIRDCTPRVYGRKLQRADVILLLAGYGLAQWWRERERERVYGDVTLFTPAAALRRHLVTSPPQYKKMPLGIFLPKIRCQHFHYF